MSRGKSRQYRAITSNSIHFERFSLNKSGKSIEEIAEIEGVRPEAIRRSIESVELYRHKNTSDTLNQTLINTLVRLEEGIFKALKRGLEATRKVEGEKGKTIDEVDHTTQLRAVAEARQFAAVVQPKAGPSHQVNVGVGVGVAQQTRVATGGYIGMEDRLREIRKLRENQTVEAKAEITIKQLESVDADFQEPMSDDESDE